MTTCFWMTGAGRTMPTFYLFASNYICCCYTSASSILTSVHFLASHRARFWNWNSPFKRQKKETKYEGQFQTTWMMQCSFKNECCQVHSLGFEKRVSFETKSNIREILQYCTMKTLLYYAFYLFTLNILLSQWRATALCPIASLDSIRQVWRVTHQSSDVRLLYHQKTDHLYRYREKNMVLITSEAKQRPLL